MFNTKNLVTVEKLNTPIHEKNLEAIKLLTNHRDPIVEDIINYYEEELSHITSSTFSGSSKK